MSPLYASQLADSGAHETPLRPRRSGNGAAATPLDQSAILSDIPGISGDTVTSELRDAVARLMAERDRLRNRLTEAYDRIASLERLADEDALTLVANRRAFVRQLARMIAFSQRYGVPASIAYFDVNNMKQINDTYGHLAGDAALHYVATVLRDNVRASDTVGRLGGDEFGVILAHIDERRALDKAVALNKAIAATPLLWGGTAIRVSAAYGVHSFAGRGGDGGDAQQAIEAADRAMYLQKRTAARAAARERRKIRG
jgi:diguanylate cyclase (GGDEF)-like protein